MYKKYSIMLLLCNGILLLVLFNIKRERPEELLSTLHTKSCTVSVKNDKEGYHPVIRMRTLFKEKKHNISDNDYEVLIKIVEAEAGGEDIIGKILVANVVLNRVESEDFPNTVSEVVFQNENGVCQFSPVSNGRFAAVEPGSETEEAVKRALDGEDYSNGALYFAAEKYADVNKMKWFEDNLQKVLSHGGHEFYL